LAEGGREEICTRSLASGADFAEDGQETGIRAEFGDTLETIGAVADSLGACGIEDGAEAGSIGTSKGRLKGRADAGTILTFG